jgi:hypothetical protein
MAESPEHWRVVGEIVRRQTRLPSKAIYLQKLEHEETGRVEVRLGYYIIGKKPGMLGRWVWGQYATFLPMTDFRAICRAAVRKGWFSLD